MDGQVSDLPLDAVAELLGLGPCPLQGDDHIAQGHAVGAGVQIVAPIAGRIARLQLEHGEAQHIRGPVDVPGGQVDGVDARVIRDQNVDLAQGRDALGVQGGLHAALDVPGHGDVQQRGFFVGQIQLQFRH